MTKEQSEMLMLMNHPFARPLIALGRTLYVQTVTINSAQPDFDIEISNCAIFPCSYRAILYMNKCNLIVND